ncbi:MAG: hypothetical protein ACKO7Q_08825 [Actinomycetota bacterium]
MASHTLEVGLRGTRNYVQGSQILARTAEIIARDHPDAALVTAKFTRITLRGVELVVGEGEAPSGGDEIGRGQFQTGGERLAVRWFEAPGPEAPRIEDVPGATSGLAPDGAGGGRADFAIAGTFESYLAAVIECVKALHAGRGERVSDIWFTALVGACLPAAPAYPTAGSLAVELKVERMVEGRLQTLSVVETAGAGAPPAYQICFSCVIGD